MYFSLEFVFKRDIIAEQKGDGCARVCEGAPSQDGSIYAVSLLSKNGRNNGASIRHSYIDSSLISGVPYRASIGCIVSLE